MSGGYKCSVIADSQETGIFCLQRMFLVFWSLNSFRGVLSRTGVWQTGDSEVSGPGFYGFMLILYHRFVQTLQQFRRDRDNL